VKLLIQPGDGILPTVKAINRAKSSIEIAIFRFDRGEVERALANAVSRGLFVHALIAYTNRGGERSLRKLEMRLLAAGVTVARTSNDLARYHGLITKNPRLVAEAVKLFEADTKRQPYAPGQENFVVSPANARRQLSAFLRGAKKTLLIYDPEISDPAMIRILEDRAAAGVDVRIIGKVAGRGSGLASRKLGTMRLHTRTIVRDRDRVFIGSQSLREIELDKRREIGLIVRERKLVSHLVKTFEADWEASEASVARPDDEASVPVGKVAKRVAKEIAKELPPVAPLLEVVVKEVHPDFQVNSHQVEETVKEAVKEAVREAVKDVVEEVAANHVH
jgi:phosphatidylserine/phosphatidylglycerophosphate/cardiolipin synthase-like enzyme